jgi:hypothetical protein
MRLEPEKSEMRREKWSLGRWKECNKTRKFLPKEREQLQQRA